MKLRPMRIKIMKLSDADTEIYNMFIALHDYTSGRKMSPVVKQAADLLYHNLITLSNTLDYFCRHAKLGFYSEDSGDAPCDTN
jgi:hypothetical protein